jgi:periplasmic protein CpxP/Spy
MFGVPPEPYEINRKSKGVSMKSTRIRILTVGAAVLLAVAAAIAQGRHGYGGPGGDFHHMLGFFTRALDLTTDEQTQVKAIWEKEKPTLQPLMQQMRQYHSDKRALEASGPFDEAKTRALATSHAQIMIEMEVQHARIKSEMMQVLTADQKAKLAQIEAKHEARMGKHMAAPPAD